MAEPPNNKNFLNNLTTLDWLKIAAIIIVALFLLYRCLLPFRAEYVFREAFTAESQQNFPKAIEKYLKVWKLAPWETYYLTSLGRIYENQARQITNPEERLAKIKQAEEVYDWCLNISPTNPWYVIRKGEIYGMYAEIESDPEKKAELIAQRETKILEAAELDKNNAIFQMTAGNLFLQRREYDKAIERYEHALIIDDRTAEAYLRLAEIYTIQNNPQKREELYKAWTEKAPEDANSYLYLGQLYDATNRHAEAVALYKTAANLDKKNEAAFRLLGNALYRDQDWADMEKAYNRLTVLKSDNADYYLFKAQAQAQQRKYKEAITSLEAAQTLRPDDANIRANLNNLKSQVK
ncbi:TPR domain containing protein [Candidatus Termititenax dinenymphae]|uniref:TPR domain containing protein n=1 Tax=Candidatus Termititenax dinenymphae TaxID=2218523 RepID=A0A388TJX5_9BACT|nr:TPR domain containing protein [Candidatus Termititenax dinenymphae]